jgi:hypothetical protein
VTPAWNWKSALWSGLYRSPAFLIAGWRAGLPVALRGAGVEFLLFASISGFTGAATQRFRHAQPAWKARLIILVCIPACLHLAEWTTHTVAGTHGRGRGVLMSVAMSVLASAFNWYAMRRGAFLAGREGQSLLHDLKRLPAIVPGFVAWIMGRGR